MKKMIKFIAGMAVLSVNLFLVGCPLIPCTTDPIEGLYINIQVDAEEDDVAGLNRMMNALNQRGIKATIYTTADYANRNASLIHSLFSKGYEIALHGYYTGEQLATMTYEAQKDLLTRAKQAIEGCRPCGTYNPVVGFRPQYFSQNDDTYRVLDELGLIYDSGFKAGLLCAEGHENDFAPYPMPNYDFHAVPITTTENNGKRMYLCDIGCAIGENMTSEEWNTVLQNALNEAIENHRPLIVLFHGWYTGDKDQYDYWQPFINFLDEARCKGVFVTTEELVAQFSS